MWYVLGGGLPEVDMAIVEPVVRVYVEKAGFQWAQLEELRAAVPVEEDAVAHVAAQLEANLDGLRIAGAEAWPLAVAAYEDWPEAGEVFVVSWLAFELGDEGLIGEALAMAGDAKAGWRGLPGAMAMHGADRTARYVRDWVTGSDAALCRYAVAVLVALKAEAGDLLGGLLAHEDAGVRLEACRLARLSGRKTALAGVMANCRDADEAVAMEAELAVCALGGGVGERLRAKAMEPDGVDALRAVVSAGPEEEVRAWLGELNERAETRGVAIRGAGMMGDRSVLPWLVRHIRDPGYAEVAGKAFLELFPEAKADEGDLFSMVAEDLGEQFVEAFGDDAPFCPIADEVKRWGEGRAG
jgi:uncharacterized protein (TIGR02270 family)